MMKSIFTTTFMAILAIATLNAQNLVPGKLSFSAGIGMVPTFFADGANVNTPPVNIRIGYQVSPAFSLSGYAGYASSTSTSPFVISDGQISLIDNQQYLLGLRGEFRKVFTDKVEVYGGGMFGYNHTSTREFDSVTNEPITRSANDPSPYAPDGPNGKFLYSGFVGSTYYFNKTVGVFAELGYGISLLNTGVTIRI